MTKADVDIGGRTRAGRTDFVATAGRLCAAGAALGAVGGLVLAVYPPAVPEDRFSYPFPPAGFVAAQASFLLNHVLLLVGFLGLHRSGALGVGRAGRIGADVAMAGMALLALCEVWAMTLADAKYPSPRTDPLDTAYGVATIAIGAGLVVAGVAVLRARRWDGWARYVTLACGVAVFVVVLPGVFGPFLAGRLVLVAWMLMFVSLGLALMRDGAVSPEGSGRGRWPTRRSASGAGSRAW